MHISILMQFQRKNKKDFKVLPISRHYSNIHMMFVMILYTRQLHQNRRNCVLYCRVVIIVLVWIYRIFAFHTSFTQKKCSFHLVKVLEEESKRFLSFIEGTLPISLRSRQKCFVEGRNFSSLTHMLTMPIILFLPDVEWNS